MGSGVSIALPGFESGTNPPSAVAVAGLDSQSGMNLSPHPAELKKVEIYIRACVVRKKGLKDAENTSIMTVFQAGFALKSVLGSP